MDKVVNITEVLQGKQYEIEKAANLSTMSENMTMEKVNVILHLPSYLDGDDLHWWEDMLHKYEISEMDLCYDVLTMEIIQFEKQYLWPFVWVEAAEYVFYYLKSYKENDEYNEYPEFFERLKRHGEKRKLTSLEDLKSKKEWEHVKKCLQNGKKGVIQLVDERIKKGFLDTESYSFNQFIEMAERLNKNLFELFTDSVSLSAYDFYKKHEWNWYMAIDETIFYLASLKWTDNENYEESFNTITEYMK